jgi:uncharacterized protein YdiU (UPF0061 family)
MKMPLPLINPTRIHQLPDSFYRSVQPDPLNNPYLVAFSPAMAELLNISPELFEQQALIDQLSGSLGEVDSDPLAMLYAGHQFGHFVPQLGDGRAMLIGELKDSHKENWEVQLKGSGLTPFSRMGDGRAVLRSTIREFLCSEALAGLGIPTTRALCITGSKDPVYREQAETAAILTRVSKSHLRFGNFEVFFYRQQYHELKILADFVIEHFYPDCRDFDNPYTELLRQVLERTASLIAQWQLVGFTHGVLNTDNMSILGDTIDYGPFGFLDHFESSFVCNHTDAQGRYAYDQQPRVGLFNLSCLAQTLLPLIDSEDGNHAAEQAKSILEQYQPAYQANYYHGMAMKLGFESFREGDEDLFTKLFQLMEGQVDFTIFFRALGRFEIEAGQASIRDMFLDRVAFDHWFTDYQARLSTESQTQQDRCKLMNQVNPKFILRNYLAQNAIEEAEGGDFSEVTKLTGVLQHPYANQPESEQYADHPPDWARHLDLSCSS